jgi:polyisoprenoid-binding protein YceI
MRTTSSLETWLLLVTVVSAALFPTASNAQASPQAVTAPLLSGTLSFSAHATVGDFTGSTSTVTGSVSGDVANPRGWVEAPAADLVTHNDRRDRDMRSSLEVGTYPTIRFNLTSATVTSGQPRGDTISVVLHGTLAIHGVTRAVSPPATIVRNGDTIHVATSFPVDLRDYEIGGLTKMFGMLRMDPNVGVHADLRFVAPRLPKNGGSLP